MVFLNAIQQCSLIYRIYRSHEIWLQLSQLSAGILTVANVETFLRNEYSSYGEAWGALLEFFSDKAEDQPMEKVIDLQLRLLLARTHSDSISIPPIPGRLPISPSSNPVKQAVAPTTSIPPSRSHLPEQQPLPPPPDPPMVPRITANRKKLLSLARSSSKGAKSASKLKGSSCTSDEEEDSDNILNAETDENHSSGETAFEGKPGRLSKALRAEVKEARAQYHQKLRQLSQKSGKTMHALLVAAGDVVKDDRSLNVWNAWQHYAIAPDGLGWSKAEDQDDEAFNEEIRQAYLRINNDPEVKETKEGVLAWYRKKLAMQTQGERLEGLTEKKMLRMAEPFIARVSYSLHLDDYFEPDCIILFRDNKSTKRSACPRLVTV